MSDGSAAFLINYRPYKTFKMLSAAGRQIFVLRDRVSDEELIQHAAVHEVAKDSDMT